MQYILERNARTATAIGVVGASGIGIELKGPEQVSHRVRRRRIASG